MPDTSHNSQKPSTPKSSLLEKSSSGPLPRAQSAPGSFVNFILSTRSYPTPRGNLIAIFKTLIAAQAFPTVERWADLCRFMRSRSASDQTQARRLWNEYQKSKPAGASPRRQQQQKRRDIL
jgi:hypothetical protein